MSHDEFKLNKDLLQEIVENKRDLQDNILKAQAEKNQARTNFNNSAANKNYLL